MPTVTKSEQTTPPEEFHQKIVEALENFDNPTWLGENSPLAMPYFLGAHLSSEDSLDAQKRGEVLCLLLRKAVNRLDDGIGGQDTLYRKVLLGRFLEKKSKTVEGAANEIGIGRATFFRKIPDAIRRLAAEFVNQLKPALRLEAPLYRPVLGRTDLQHECIHQLKRQATIGLTGPSGIGKTSLAISIAHEFAPQNTFWFTICPGLNDNQSSLLYSLGFFLHQFGHSNLWGNLIASEGTLDLEIAISMFRYALKHASSEVFLFCIDEVDLLRPGSSDSHAQVMALIDSLKDTVPMLLIGQQLPVETDILHTLAGLHQSTVAQMFALANIHLPVSVLRHLVSFSGGNPRIVELFIALQKSGEDIEEVLANHERIPSMEYLVDRIWRRLDDAEQKLIAGLSVFRGPAPTDAWSSALHGLAARGLIRSETTGGISLMMGLSEVIYQLLPDENRQLLHLDAAKIREMRGEYTSAMYHYIQARLPHVALSLWDEHQLHEIGQGQTETAAVLLNSIPLAQLEQFEQERLIVLRTLLNNYQGDYASSHQDLRRTVWYSHVLQTQAKRLEGDIAEIDSRYEDATNLYQEGLHSIENLLAETSNFRKNLGWANLGNRNLEQAWEQALLARYEAENLLGYIEDSRGNYSNSEAYFQTAIEQAQSLGYELGEAKTLDNLANVLARQQRFEEAEEQLLKAELIFGKIGNFLHLAGVTVNQAFLYNLSGQPTRAIESATKAIELFEQLGQTHGRAVAAQNIAEAYFALEKWDKSERYAMQVVKLEDTETLPDGLRILGEVATKRHQFSRAFSYLDDSIKQAQANQDRYLEAYAWRSLGQLYEAQAIQHKKDDALKKALAIFESLELPHEISNTINI